MDKEFKEKLIQFNKLENKLRSKWLDYASKSIKPLLPEGVGCMELYYEKHDCRVNVFMNNDSVLLKKYAIDNINIWNYLVNELFLNERKVVSFGKPNYDLPVLSLSKYDYAYLDSIYEDEVYKKLHDEIFKDESDKK
jgi:predicted PolB exonuclease-like 3'-5' exonuclease